MITLFMHQSRLTGLIVLAILGLVPNASSATSIRILPERIVLNGTTAQQQVLVQRFEEDSTREQITEDILWKVSPDNILRIEGNVLTPLGTGKATLSAAVGDLATDVEVVIRDFDQTSNWSFRNHVQPILAKFGCSAGACHGAAAGKNGFKLSLRGYDDQGDFIALTRHALGRRIIPQDPGRSLLLTKPTGAIPHKGGKRFEIDSHEYRVISQWIANGFPSPQETDTRIERIDITPAQVSLKPGLSQQILVRAYFDNGRYEDVTRWAKFSSANESVVCVDENGRVEIIGYGEGAITAWYLSRIATMTITAPFESSNALPEIAAREPKNLIDREIQKKLAQLRIPSSTQSTDSQFLRRVFLNTLGILPSIEEAKAFLDDPSPAKRSALITQILKRPEFVDYWSYQWSDLLLVQSKRFEPSAMWAYYRWIRDQVARNTPWDDFVRQIVTAQGSNLTNGAANFFVLHDDPKIMAETTTQAFLGMSINCAKCHNHPLEKWTNDQYFQMANLFARIRTKNGAASNESIIFTALSGDVVQPLTGRSQPPTPLDGRPMAENDSRDRRQHLADWLVAPENPYFSRAIANRVWTNFMGVGLVEKIDDLRATNPASNESLLTGLGNYLAENDFDLKALIRLILESDAYQRNSQPNGINKADSRFYSRYYPRRLMAEVILDAFSQVTEVPTKFSGFPQGWRALQLPDSNIESYFLSSFGRADRAQTCACERTDEPSVAQVLHIANGKTLNQKLSTPNNRIGQELEAGVPLLTMVDNLYLSALSRYPTPAERSRIQKLLDEAGPSERREALEDVYWAVLSSREFLFSH
ncbi:MAG: hypothetical protein M2R45_00087 [Verrucomicrobia subdivision 3 bacterium]|nr:hypothetical protein [Limisphaerales bacterium]MCS1412455.1 hypothetical protein [Limisphaerales bacterium]